MKRLLICDCDEVLLHMVRHFRDWLDTDHDIDLQLAEGSFEKAMRHRADGELVTRERMWSLIDGFFPAEMDRQTLVPHAAEALEALGQRAEIVILTNLRDHCRESRITQLSTHGIVHRVECNQGPKGEPVARLVAEHGSPVTVFVDDLPTHHDSVAQHAPGVHRLHMVSEPSLAPHVPPAPAAHARIDDWRDAAAWITARFDAGSPAEA
ncbi:MULTISPECIES: HAD family hydrolase [Sphingomonas]|uniref:HAD family hydrolase n=1 Tax=Sphingomonas molluscorum TaxID=418184 RepID=A0ABU8Q2H1_9SPHN|nr:HAD family hydrolase [Sphingomonas sp. JUb134]MBM7405463.1 hypothetical protein [Sphingomonas sp. JUb134]